MLRIQQPEFMWMWTYYFTVYSSFLCIVPAFMLKMSSSMQIMDSSATMSGSEVGGIGEFL